MASDITQISLTLYCNERKHHTHPSSGPYFKAHYLATYCIQIRHAPKPWALRSTVFGDLELSMMHILGHLTIHNYKGIVRMKSNDGLFQQRMQSNND